MEMFSDPVQDFFGKITINLLYFLKDRNQRPFLALVSQEDFIQQTQIDGFRHVFSPSLEILRLKNKNTPPFREGQK